MASFRSQANSGWTSGSSAVVSKPSGLAVGDLMFFYLATNGNDVSPSDIPDWTYVDFNASAGSGYATYLAYKVADSSDVAASTFTWSGIQSAGSTPYFASIVAIYDVSPISSFIVTGKGTTTNTATPSITGITPFSRANNIILQFWHGQSNISSADSYAIATSNPGWTEAYDVASGNYQASCAYAVRPEVTATGNFSCAGGDATTDWNARIVSVANTLSFSVSESITLTEFNKQDQTITLSENIVTTENIDIDKQRIWTEETKNSATWIDEIK